MTLAVNEPLIIRPTHAWLRHVHVASVPGQGARLPQAQSKSIRILLVVGDDRPVAAYHFDLVGAFPRSDGSDPTAFYSDIVLRMVTSGSTSEVVEPELMPEPI